MQAPGTPEDELERLQALIEAELLDTAPEAAFDALVELAAAIAEVPIALVSLVDAERQWFKARVGLAATETSREVSFCGHVVAGGEALVVPDALDDPRFADNPLVLGDPRVRFYAGFPLRTPEGHVLGTLCAIDHRPRTLDGRTRTQLELLSRQVATLIEVRRERARARSQQAARDAWAASPLGIASVGPSLEVRSANPALEHILGVPSGTLEGRSLVDWVVPIDRRIVRAMVRDVVARGVVPTRREVRFLRPGGAIVLTGFSAAPLAGDAVRGAVCVVRDVSSERAPPALARVLEEVASEIDTPLANALDRLSDGMPDRGAIAASIESARALVVARMSDLGGRLRAEAALRSSERRFRALVEHLIDPLFVLDEEGRVVDVNPAGCEALGADREAIVGAPIARAVPLLDATRVHRDLAALMVAPEQTLTVEGELVRDAAPPVPIELRSVLVDWDGPPRVLVVLRDVSERRAHEAAMRAANVALEQRVQERTAELEGALRAKDDFLANMSHELRTPLNGVLGLCEALLEGVYGPLEARQRKALGTVEQSGRHLLALIQDVLEIARARSAKQALDLAPADAFVIAREALQIVRPIADEKGLRLSLSLEGEVGLALLDARRIRQVLVNLLGNAIKFTPRGGAVRLEVALSTDPAELTFRVHDTGIGISPADQARIFEPFTQASDGLARAYEGSGLGLALVLAMVDLHGGSVEVQSALGQGSTFVVRIPAPHAGARSDVASQASSQDARATGRSDGAEAEQAATPASPEPSRGRVLVVDDNAVSADLVASFLEAEGYVTEVVSDGALALAAARATRPDVILMDVQMPGMDGLEATRRLRADPALATIPVVAVTALAMNGDRERCLAAGADEYAPKPVRLSALRALVARFVTAA